MHGWIICNKINNMHLNNRCNFEEYIFVLKGVMTWEIKFAWILWHIRGLCKAANGCLLITLNVSVASCQKQTGITITAAILSTPDKVYKCTFTFWHSPRAWVCQTNGEKERSLWRVWFKQLVRVFVQISEGSQCQEQVDSLFLMASRIVSRIDRIVLFCKRASVSWRVHKEFMLKYEAVLDLTAAASNRN